VFTFIRRFWFPATLLSLVLLSLPGLVLFLFALFDADSSLNDWLEDHFRLSYHTPLSWYAGLLLFLIPLAILALYFLKLKRKPLQVPSTFLWRKSIEDLHVNSFLQWMRENVLLLLQLLFVVCCIYALMAFRFHGRTGEGVHYILMIDNSASMSATDVAPNRLEAAKAEALKEIDAARDGDFGMVLVFNSSAEILQSYTSNRDLLRRAIESIRPTQRPTRLEEALTLADSLANPTRSTDDGAVKPVDAGPGQERTYVSPEGTQTEVHLYSDGRFSDVPDFSLGNLNLKFHSAGKPGLENLNNVGIVRMNATRSETDPTQVQVLVRVLNFCPKETEAVVELEAVPSAGGNKSIYEQPVKMPAATEHKEADAPEGAAPVREPGEGIVTFDLKDQDDQTEVLLHARLKVPDKSVLANLDLKSKKTSRWVDDFAQDDEAYLVLGVVRKARIMIVSKGDRFLDNFFSDNVIGKVATIKHLDPKDLSSEADYLQPARNGDYDLFIFDLCGPAKEEDMPRGNTLFIGQPPPGWQKPDSDDKTGKPVEKVQYPQVRGWDAKAPLMRDLNALHTVGIIDAFRMKELPSRVPVLIESDNQTPLMLSLSRGPFKDVVMTFSLFNAKDESNTNWPLHPSFPLFLRNVVRVLGNLSDAVAEENTQPGAQKTIRPDVGVPEITVLAPDGTSTKVQRGTRADFSFGATEQSGIYRVAWQDKVERSFAVNLLDPDESDIGPRASVQIGAQATKADKSRAQPQELWRWVILVALGLLMLEWYIYNRRVYI
jgi:hypothetical protein